MEQQNNKLDVQRLQKSKERLARAFDLLENIIKKKMETQASLNFQNNNDEEIEKLSKENIELKKELANVKSKYDQANKVNVEVLSDIDDSIDRIEKLMNNVTE
jgi:ribosomal protein L31E